MTDSDPEIAVLVCDTPIAGVTETYGDFGDNAVDLVAGAGLHGYVLTKYQVAFEGDNQAYISGLETTYTTLRNKILAGTIKGVFLTGSRSDSFDNDNPWIARLDGFIHFLFQLGNFPIVGVCFGHQILAKNLGCKVGRNEAGWELGTTTIEINQEVRRVEQSPFVDVVAPDVESHLNLVEFHRDAVHGLPPPLTVEKWGTKFLNVGSTAKCPIQGLVTQSGPLKLLTFQGHPEFSTPQAHRFLDLDLEKKLYEVKQYEKASYNTRILNNQGPEVGKVIARFFSSHAS